jgi:hypothetical protein
LCALQKEESWALDPGIGQKSLHVTTKKSLFHIGRRARSYLLGKERSLSPSALEQRNLRELHLLDSARQRAVAMLGFS